jgi:hypothetical protein
MLSLDASSYLLGAGFALAIYIFLRRRRTTEPEQPRRPFATVRPLSALKEREGERPIELLRWQVEMHDIARQLKAELDSKLSALQALVILAKRESERLEIAIQKAESLDLPPPNDSLAILERLGDPAALEDPRALSKASASLPMPPDRALADPFAGEQTDLKIANLAATDLSACEIAHRLNMPLGEVELRLNVVATQARSASKGFGSA